MPIVLLFGFLQVYGLGTGPKTDVLATLIAEHAGAEIHFVEDRVETLEGISTLICFQCHTL
jgi:hypothetical protein